MAEHLQYRGKYMYVNFRNMLKKAYSSHQAIGSFNWYNFETLAGIADAAEKLKSPVIVSFGAKYLSNMSLETAVALTKAVAKEHSVPICLHLDHCSDKLTVLKAIDLGFGSVMYDGSKLSFDDNVMNTKEICDIAHDSNVTVEAELGSLAASESSHEGSADDKEIYTSAEDAAKFIRYTGVDALAVSIGTVHGMYKGTPNIRTDILAEINEATGIPLVLHGGSGTPEDKLIECINCGISKINVNTEISEYVISRTRDYLETEHPHYSVLSLKQREWAQEVVEKYIRLFENN